MRIVRDVEEAKRTVLRRVPLEGVQVSPVVAGCIKDVFGASLSPSEAVGRILEDVRLRGDAALYDWTERLDRVRPQQLEVPGSVVRGASQHLPSALVEAVRVAAERVAAFHRAHLLRPWMDFSPAGALGQMIVPLERVGIYAPGGRAAYPSSILMQVVPAKVAGVREVIVTSPPGANGLPADITLAACDVAGVDRVFAVGGAQAIAAMAYGTESVPRVDKVLGPGNIFVALAKRQVFGEVAIDQIAGPTETVIIADSSAKAEVVALDLLAQAEHDPLASAILITTSEELAAEVERAVEAHLNELPTSAVAAESLARNGGIVVVDSLEVAIELANGYAPEHLCLVTDDPWKLVPLVRNAGGVFLGADSPEVMGDYVAGPSHVMPTGGTARFFSPLNSSDFVKVIPLIGLGQRGLEELGPAAAAIADAEGLAAHARAVRVRLTDKRTRRRRWT